MIAKLGAVVGAVGLALVLAGLPWQRAGETAPPTAPDRAYERGLALFSAKGCAHCHRHAAVSGSGQFGATFGDDTPDLTQPRFAAEYLRVWLKDPQAVRPGTPMPNLELKESEIEELIVFLTASGEP